MPMRESDAVLPWAREEFRRAELGDPRRRRRLQAMTAAVARAPSGKVSEVFRSAPEREGAYDFVENAHVDPAAMVAGMGGATAARSASRPFVFVPVDGCSLSVVDHSRAKGFGTLTGRAGHEASGVKVITALSVDPCGVPLGVAAQRYWSRPVRPAASRTDRKKESWRRLDFEKETAHWVGAIDDTLDRFKWAGAHPWFVIDREGDAQSVLTALWTAGTRFTIRSSGDRTIDIDRRAVNLRQQLQTQAVLGRYEVDVLATSKRKARCARMVVRTAEVLLRLRIGDTRFVHLMPITVVWAREVGTTPVGEEPLDWMLLTNHEVQTLDDARLVIFSYTTRWRIEELHKAWKSGVCGIEDTQLRSHAAVVRWAIVLVAVSARSERLKHLSREQPDQPATIELSEHEIRALILLKRRHKKRTEQIPSATPSMKQAVLWLAELGGYTGKSSGGPPGAITIGRGLQYVRGAADMLEQLGREN